MNIISVKRFLHLILVIVIFVFLYSTPLYSQEEITLTTHNLCPYGSYDTGREVQKIADETFNGVAVEVVRSVLKKMNIKLEIQVVPWARAQYMAKNGESDGFFAASQKDSRDDFAVMSAIIAEQNWNWYILKENELSPELSNFKEKAEVSGFAGSNMVKVLEENNYNIKAIPHTTEQLLKILLAKRVDAVMANNHVMEALLKKYQAEDRVKIYLYKNKPLGVYFSKVFVEEHPNFLDEFNQLVPESRLHKKYQ